MKQELTPDYDLAEVAAAMKMSTRWVREQIRAGAEHQRYGHKIRFTQEQFEKLRAQHAQTPVAESITTGRKRRSA